MKNKQKSVIKPIRINSFINAQNKNKPLSLETKTNVDTNMFFDVVVIKTIYVYCVN